VAVAGAVNVSEELEAVEAVVRARLTATASSDAVLAKFAPETVTTVDPGSATAGETPLMVGACGVATSVKGVELDALPFGDVTVTLPVAAPAGTITVSCVVVAAVTVPVDPPVNVTVSWLGVALNFVP
jgi:spore coat protein U-like protein